jgi:UDP-glucose 4-epimerase
MYREQYGLDIVITRFANVYGLRCHGVIHDFLEKLAKNPNKLEIIGTGQQSRDLVHISDVVELLTKVGSLESANGQTYNVGLGKTTKIIDLAKLMLQILNLQDKTVVTTTGVSWQGDIVTIWFNNQKAKKELNWNPRVTLEDSIKEVIAARKLSK